MHYAPLAVIRHRIPLNRLTPEHFRWDGEQGADTTAFLDCKRKGRGRLAILCLARIAQSLLVLLPGLARARLTKNAAEALDYKVASGGTWDTPAGPWRSSRQMVPAGAVFQLPDVPQGADHRPTRRADGDGVVKLLQVYNDYRSFCGGEGAVVQMIAAIVAKHGGTARLLTRPSKGLDRSLSGRSVPLPPESTTARPSGRWPRRSRPIVPTSSTYTTSIRVFAFRARGVPKGGRARRHDQPQLPSHVSGYEPSFQGTRVREVHRRGASIGAC